MISDVLSDAAHNIRDYLADPATADCYREPEIQAGIVGVLAAMDTLRTVLDTPPPTLARRPVAALDTDRLTLGELRATLLPELEKLDESLDYFSRSGTDTARAAQPIGRYRWISCWAVTGGSEGHYVHVDRVYLEKEFDREFKRESLFLAKTFGGYDRACEIAAYLGARLGV